jgi:hypothetical protein
MSTAPRYRVTNDRYTADTDCIGTLEELQKMCDDAGWDQPTTLTADGDCVRDEDNDVVARRLRTYHVAEMVESTGGWDIRETFEATDDDEAVAYAEENYAQTEWYVLDENRRNVLA